MLAFAKCMREHGVDMPDPVVNADGGMTVTIGSEGGKPIDQKTMQAADEACKHLMPARPDGGPTQMTPEQQDAMLDFAKCMREHGVDMPDPDFGSGGGPVMIGGDGIAFDSPTFKAADEACRSIMTDAMPGLVGGGAGGPSVSGSGPIRAARPTPGRVSMSSRPNEAATDRPAPRVRGGRRRRWRSGRSRRSGSASCRPGRRRPTVARLPRRPRRAAPRRWQRRR